MRAVGGIEAEGELDPLGSPVEQSLALAGTRLEDETRYRMLEPIRQYALELLERSGEEEETRGSDCRELWRSQSRPPRKVLGAWLSQR